MPFLVYLANNFNNSYFDIFLLFTRWYNPVKLVSKEASIAFANSNVVTPDQNTFEYPFIFPSCLVNHLNNPIPFSFSSGPTIEVLNVKVLSLFTSPIAFDLP